MKYNILALATVFIGFWFFYSLFQNEKIYNHSLKYITKNWTNQNGERKLVEKPFDKITNENLLQWDGVHYNFIKENRYDVGKAGGEYIFAFFPLFPLIWDLTNLPPIGIVLFNYLLFAIALLVLAKTFNLKDKVQFQLSLAFPGLVCFLIPYTEATFMFVTVLGIYGFVKKKYWIYFIGFALASMTRPTITILFLSILVVEFIFLLRNRNLKSFVVTLVKNTFPLIIGTLIVSVYQLYYNSNSLFKFAEVQSLWGKKFGFPHQIIDWSHEGFGMSIAVFSFIFLPMVYLFLKLSISSIRNQNEIKSDRTTYLILLSIIYMIGTTFYIILFQNGCINGFYRYTQCTPFFFILIFNLFDYVKSYSNKKRVFIFLLLLIIGVLNLIIIPYSNRWNFSDMGFFVFSFAMLLWVLQDKSQNLPYRTALIGLLIINLIWTGYLFNTYISNGWIFT